jgi:hypothetical protein
VLPWVPGAHECRVRGIDRALCSSQSHQSDVMGEGSTMCLKQQGMMGSAKAWCHAQHGLIHEQCIGFGTAAAGMKC